MSQLFIPLLLAVIGLLAAIATYRGIRRGGARFYTLEREAVLRQASITLLVSVLFFAGAVGYLVYERQQIAAEEAAAKGETVEGVVTNTPEIVLEQFPPTVSFTSTPDLSQPTPTGTPIICRAVVEGTSGNGLTLRDSPGGTEMSVLPDGSILTLLADTPEEANGLVWRKVRQVGGDEGWVAQDFLTIRAPCE